MTKKEMDGTTIVQQYVAPQIEVIEVAVEKGFSVSMGGDVTVSGWDNGGTIDGGEAEGY